jgi:hypothetical protein
LSCLLLSCLMLLLHLLHLLLFLTFTFMLSLVTCFSQMVVQLDVSKDKMNNLITLSNALPSPGVNPLEGSPM